MAPVVRELQKYPERVRSVVCITAQHREMLDQVLSLFRITPDYDLDIMEDNQTPVQVASAVLYRAWNPFCGESDPTGFWFREIQPR
jgi:UDP-N-acetylglucosamine 2-epimerase (non-hydrolysing)